MAIDRLTADEITRYLNDHIPATAALAIRVTSFDGAAVTTVAPLAANVNHRDTMFGGSLATIGIVSGWSLIWAALQTEGIPNRLVIQKSETEFLRPATDDVEATTEPLAHLTFDRFCHGLRRKGRARIQVRTAISCKGETVAIHFGCFVTMKLDAS